MKTSADRAEGPQDPKKFEDQYGHLPPWCFVPEAMEITALSEVTLQRRRTKGMAPTKHHKNAGRVVYLREGLYDFMMGKDPENFSDLAPAPEVIENRAQTENVKPKFSMRTGRVSVRGDV